MAHVITQPCIGVKDTACVSVCPVDCIPPRAGSPFRIGANRSRPDVCTGCASACTVPVRAIFAEETFPLKAEVIDEPRALPQVNWSLARGRKPSGLGFRPTSCCSSFGGLTFSLLPAACLCPLPLLDRSVGRGGRDGTEGEQLTVPADLVAKLDAARVAAVLLPVRD